MVNDPIFKGGSHVIPMVFAYSFVFFSLWFALAYAHSLRVGYVAKAQARAVQATLLAICCFYPYALVLCALFLALLPLNTFLAVVSTRSYSLEVPPTQKDDSEALQLVIEVTALSKFTVEANLQDSLYDLKLALLVSLGDEDLGPNDIYLELNEEVLLNDSYTLKEYKVESGSTLKLFSVSEEVKEEPMCPKLCEWLSACCEAVTDWVREVRECCCLCLLALCRYPCRRLARRERQLEEVAHVYRHAKSFRDTRGVRAGKLGDAELQSGPIHEPKRRRTKAVNYVKDALRNVSFASYSESFAIHNSPRVGSYACLMPTER